MNQYMALISNDSATPALYVDTTVPLEILLDAANREFWFTRAQKKAPAPGLSLGAF